MIIKKRHLFNKNWLSYYKPKFQESITTVAKKAIAHTQPIMQYFAGIQQRNNKKNNIKHPHIQNKQTHTKPFKTTLKEWQRRLWPTFNY